jgi:hypothetical protein
MEYVIAIPSYQRPISLETKTLKTLKDGGINADKIYIFVASNQEYDIYYNKIPKDLYKEIIVGELGIANQRIFISKFFKDQVKIVSCDDDIEEFHLFISKKEKAKITDLNKMFINNFKQLEIHEAYFWGMYPVSNPYFMSDKIRTGLYFCIGVCHGYINRHIDSLYPSVKSEGKEDYESNILFYLNDKKILRFDYLSFKTKFNAVGGLGKFRFDMNKKAQEYLVKQYPKFCKATFRKNGMAEIKLNNNHTFEVAIPDIASVSSK